MVIPNAFPGYISWDTYLANQQRLAENAAGIQWKRGAPRTGQALLQGIALCARCSKDKRIVREAPVVVIEVLSPEDRINRYHQRIADYRAMGVKAIWVVDPENRRGWDCSSGNWIATADFHLAPVYMNLAEVWAELDA